MRSRSFLGLNPKGFHRLHYTEWGSPDDGTIVCVHGLSQNARSFDALAGNLQSSHRVACLDVVGRGQSGWLADAAGYNYAQYMADANALIARLGVDRIDWVGTSMGGLIGIMLAAMPDSPIRRLVINDIGPFVPKVALERIGAYMVGDNKFADMMAFESYLRKVYAPFGPLSDEQWQRMATHGARQNDDGTISPSYDPAITDAFRHGPMIDVDIWSFWDAISCPVLVLRGAESDILLSDTASEMTRRGPEAELLEFTGIGHAPALQADGQIAAIRGFLGA
ncbi:MAG: alpha/beta fold hydrolase [Alphaproteobacteria bacterium]|nr:alpha/beta fold hydrolase [Alphaproteobacteria bacterium]